MHYIEKAMFEKPVVVQDIVQGMFEKVDGNDPLHDLLGSGRGQLSEKCKA